jgi:16S rRNA (guanine966-N2)-methyltransferase
VKPLAKNAGPKTTGPKKEAAGKLRIIGGVRRGRSIAVAADGVRPTSDRAREAVFNRLIHGFSDHGFRLPGARVVDVFAGSGALGLEALSRGAVHATFLERDPAVAELIRQNIAHLGAEDRAFVMGTDAKALPRASVPCDLALLDPPYGEDVMTQALASLARQGWLKPGALIVAETEGGALPVTAEDFMVIDRRDYGRAAMTFLIYSQA